jgi:hypothetical protein
MGDHRPQTVLERVARLEAENADLAARIARIHARRARADTVSTRSTRPRPGGRHGLAFAFVGVLCGFAAAWAARTAAVDDEVASEPPPAVEPLPPTPPVYGGRPTRFGGARPLPVSVP